MTGEDRDAPRDFIREIVHEDLRAGRHREIVTRFPPEPNGYLHIGHAEAICLDFGVAAETGGRCHLRFDDTNPEKEEAAFAEGIKEDVRWLGFDWGEHEYHASDYFGTLYGWAEQLVGQGDAYVCDCTAEEIRAARGTLTEPGRDCPHRGRGPEESLDLLRRMRAGEFPNGARTLRARIDMASPNLNLRDPVMYRIQHAPHHRTGDAWCIYPMYDWAHGQSDSIEGVTHSLCDLDFENHRPLYDWFLERLGVHRPRQIEFARLNITHTITSKRKLLKLVEGGHVSGWDDPRMPTLRGLRRRGYTPESIREFCRRVGIAKSAKTAEVALLEHCLREDLNRRAPRFMGVLRPLRVVLENFPADEVREVEAVNNPEDPAAGTRRVPFGRELFIEREDFAEDPPPKFHRLAPGREVRLRAACLVTCTGVERGPDGSVEAVRCTWDPETWGGTPPDGRKVKGTLHWVSAAHAVDAEVRLYDHLFAVPEPEKGTDDFLGNLNPSSLEVVRGAKVEPALGGAEPGTLLQFERLGYFAVDRDAAPGAPVFNRSVTLRDTWAKVRGRGG